MSGLLNIQLLPAQWEIFNDRSRFKVIACGRRFGKTTLAAYEIIVHALTHANEVSWCISPTYPQTMLLWRKVKSFLPKKYIKEIKEGVKCITLKNNHEIWAKSADHPDSLRGEGLSMAVLDEFASMKPDAWTEAIRPALADKKGRAIFIGTPKGKNHFYDLFIKQRVDPEYKSFSYPMWANPLIDDAEVEKLKEELPELIFRQEIIGEFIDTGGVVFTSYKNNLVPLTEPDYSAFTVFGLDLAKTQDYTVLIGYQIDKPVVYRRFTQRNWEAQISLISNILKKFSKYLVYIDSTGVGDPVCDRLIKDGIYVKPINITGSKGVGTNRRNIGKNALIENLEMMLENNLIFIPNVQEADEEFGSFTYKLSETGRIIYGAPEGHHDDIVMAVSLAAWGLRRTVEVVGVIDNRSVDKGPYGQMDEFDYDFEELVSWDESESFD